MSEVLPQFKDPSVLTSLLVGISSKSVRALCPMNDGYSSLALTPLPKCKEANVFHQTLVEKGKLFLQFTGVNIYEKIGMNVYAMHCEGQ